MNYSQETNCGVDIPIEQVANLDVPCFDVEQLLDDCKEGTNIYMRVNLHYFTNDDCSGNLQVVGIKQEDAYKHADDFIKEANAAIANNQPQWGVQGATAPCNPLRYVLSGVYIHCLSGANGGNVTNLHNIYGENKDTEINYYIANFPGGTTGQGWSTYGVIDWINTGNFNHELGHTFSLKHSWFDDGLEDTPIITYNWDSNCDGDINDGVDKINAQCWNIIEDGISDSNNNGTYDCNEIAPCIVHPCCSWENINNNVMAYNAYENAYTQQQINQILNHIAYNETKCDMIDTISNCAPPKAIVGQTPFTFQNDNPCNECIYFSGSSNEVRFKYDVYENVIGGRTCIFGQGWQSGDSDKFCYGVGTYGVSNKLNPNTSYTIRLTIENECGMQDEVEYTFTTGPACTPDAPTEFVLGYPNPSDDSFRLSYYSIDAEMVSISAYHTLTGTLSLISSNYQILEGENEINLNINNLPIGSNIIMISGNSIFIRSQVLKI